MNNNYEIMQQEINLIKEDFYDNIEKIFHKYRINYIKISNYMDYRTQYFVKDKYKDNYVFEFFWIEEVIARYFDARFKNVHSYNPKIKNKHIILLKIVNKILQEK